MGKGQQLLERTHRSGEGKVRNWIRSRIHEDDSRSRRAGSYQVLSFGFILCFDTFLHTFTILPIRAVLAAFRIIVSTVMPSR